jgi:hypothetical protein
VSRSSGKGFKLNWRGDEVIDQVAEDVIIPAIGDFGLEVEGNAKRELKPGRGKKTGTLQRSIHTAPLGYNWASDDVMPGEGTPERGNKKVTAKRVGHRIALAVGSGLKYAMAVHQGHGVFGGIKYLVNGLQKSDIKKHIERRALK